MLTTLAMVVIAVTVLITARGGRRSTDLTFDVPVLRQDLGYFLVMYSLAVVAGLLDSKPVDYLLVIVLMVGYAYYVRRHFQTPRPEEANDEVESEGGADIEPLYVWQALRRAKASLPSWEANTSVPAPFVQVGVALALIIGGAELFIHAVDQVARPVRHLPAGLLALGGADRHGAPGEVQQRALDPPAQGHTRARQHDGRHGLPVVVPGHDRPAVDAVAPGGAGAGRRRDRAGRGRHALAPGAVPGAATGPLLLLQGIFYVGYVTYVLTTL